MEATYLVQVLSCNLESAQKCDVSNGHSWEVSVDAMTAQQKAENIQTHKPSAVTVAEMSLTNLTQIW